MNEAKFPSSGIEVITPEIAAMYLRRNVENNRREKPVTISKYARDMKAGDWVLTGESIKFSESGKLIDGQNRLRAIIEADVEVRMFVTRNLPDDAMPLLDSGATRSSADSLVISGLVERGTAKEVSAIAQVHAGWTSGKLTTSMSDSRGSLRMSRSELHEYVAAHPGLEIAAAFAKRTYRALPLPSGALGTAYDVMTNINHRDAQDFFGRIIDGETHGIGDPILTLTRRVSSEREKAAGRTRFEASTGLFYLFRTWNAFRTGERMEKLQIGSPRGWAQIPTPK